MDIDAEVLEAERSGVFSAPFLTLTALPPQVFRVAGLVRLDVGYNMLASLPPELGMLTSLEELWVNNNPLTALPPEIGRCAALRYIDASETQLHKVPKELATLKNLVDVDLDRTLLKASQKTPYLMHGTMGLLQHLRERAERFHLKQALMETLKYSVYHEASSTDAGASMLLALVADIFEEFSDPREIRLVIRNAARLFPPLLTQATAHAVRVRHDELARDNARKQMGADLELALRALYYDRIDPTTVERTVNSITNNIQDLEEMLFLLQHFSKVMPPDASAIDGKTVYSNVLELRERLRMEREAALVSLRKTLVRMYSDADEDDVAALVHQLADALPSTQRIQALTADAGDVFPADFMNVKVKAVLKTFTELQKEKGLL